MALVTTGIQQIVVLEGESKEALMKQVVNSKDPLKIANDYLHNPSPAVQKFGCEVIAQLSPSERAKEILSEILKVKKLDEGVRTAATIVFARYGEQAIEGVQKFYDTLPSGYTSNQRSRIQQAIACPNSTVINFLLDNVDDLTSIDKQSAVYAKTDRLGITMLFDRACENIKFGYGNYARVMASMIERSDKSEDVVSFINDKLKNGNNLERGTAIHVLHEVSGKNIDQVMENLLAIINEPKVEATPKKTGFANWLAKKLGKDEGREYTQADIKSSAAYCLKKYYSAPMLDDTGLQPAPTEFAQSVFKNQVVRAVIDMVKRGELASRQNGTYEFLCAAIGIVEKNDGVKTILLNAMSSQNTEVLTFAAKTIGLMASFSHAMSQPQRAGYLTSVANSPELREKGQENIRALSCFVSELTDKIRTNQNEDFLKESVEAVGNFRGLGKKAEGLISDFLESNSVEMRIVALDALKKIGASSDRTQTLLRGVIQADSSVRAKELAIEVLSNCAPRDPNAFNVIYEQLSDPFLDRSAKKAIEKIDPDGQLRKAAAQELVIH